MRKKNEKKGPLTPTRNCGGGTSDRVLSDALEKCVSSWKSRQKPAAPPCTFKTSHALAGPDPISMKLHPSRRTQRHTSQTHHTTWITVAGGTPRHKALGEVHLTTCGTVSWCTGGEDDAGTPTDASPPETPQKREPTQP